MKDTVTMRLEKDVLAMLEQEAQRKYSNPTAVAKKCLRLALPILIGGTPESVLEAMGGKGRGK